MYINQYSTKLCCNSTSTTRLCVSDFLSADEFIEKTTKEDEQRIYFSIHCIAALPLNINTKLQSSNTLT